MPWAAMSKVISSQFRSHLEKGWGCCFLQHTSRYQNVFDGRCLSGCCRAVLCCAVGHTHDRNCMNFAVLSKDKLKICLKHIYECNAKG